MTTTTKEMKIEVAKEITNQIGRKALFMIGAKNYAYDNNMIVFKIMRNSMKVSHIRITLNVMDLYDVEFLNCRAGNVKTISEENGIYDNMLKGAIERNTGLFTNL